MDSLVSILIPIGICVVLPIMIVFIVLKHKLEIEKNKKEIITTALEKNLDVDIKELVQQMNEPEKLIKEDLLQKFHRGCLLTIAGSAIVLMAVAMNVLVMVDAKDTIVVYAVGAVAVAIGIANLLSYRLGKRLLEKEMEGEEERMRREGRK